MNSKIGALARRGFEPNKPAGFLFGVACIVIAAAMRWLLGMWFGATLYFVAFFPAVIIAALFAGFWPGMLALGLSVVIGLIAFVPSHVVTGLPAPFLSNLAIYVVAGFCTVCLGHLFRSTVRELQIEQKERELILREIEHRSRNMGALGAAIVQFTLADDRDTANLINSRMQALQKTNDLITQAPKLEPDIATIIRHELAPYGLSRCDLDGSKLPLRSDIARSIGLIVHELTTNAVKYGSLSKPEGRINIRWKFTEPLLQIDWRETGGPKTAAPARTGFGTKLIDTTVKGLDGFVEREFGDDGLHCRITLRAG